jgi:CIC family chloride channel protein
LVPLHNPDHVTRLLDFAIPLAQKNKGEIVVLVVVDVPIQLPIHEGLRFVHHKRPLLKIASDYAQEKGIEIQSDIRIAHRIADGIISSATEENASLLLMGWKGYTNTRDKIFGEVTDHVIRLTPCDLIVLKLAKFPIQRILLPSAGGANARLAAKLAQTLMKTLKAEITCCNVVPKDPSDDDLQKGREWIEKTLKDLEFGSEFNKKLVESNSVPAGLIREAKDYDLVVIGATNEGYFKRIFLGEIPEKIARHSGASVMVVKRYEGKVKSWIKKLFG